MNTHHSGSLVKANHHMNHFQFHIKNTFLLIRLLQAQNNQQIYTVTHFQIGSCSRMNLYQNHNMTDNSCVHAVHTVGVVSPFDISRYPLMQIQEPLYSLHVDAIQFVSHVYICGVGGGGSGGSGSCSGWRRRWWFRWRRWCKWISTYETHLVKNCTTASVY